jgi:dUTP pyrophosphatase
MEYTRDNVDVFIELMDNGILPKYINDGDAGMDIYASRNVILEPGETIAIPTGLKLAIPYGYEIQVRPRSGISLKTPLRIANTPGTIDCGFRNELKIVMTNTSPPMDLAGTKLLTIDSEYNMCGSYEIRRGDRIAQIVLQKIPKIKFTVVKSVADIGEDRGGGFGSSGIR